LTFKKWVFWGVDNPLKANLFENMKAFAFKFLLWNLTGSKVDQRSPATDSSPCRKFEDGSAQLALSRRTGAWDAVSVLKTRPTMTGQGKAGEKRPL